MANKPWGGRFGEKTDRRVEEFSESISFDRRLFEHDIRGSIAHAEMLAYVGLLTTDECKQIMRGLSEIRAEIEAGQFPFVLEREDIHMHVEAALIDRLGDVGRKLHTARSRNDQVATDVKLWTRDALDRIDARLLALQKAFVRAAEGRGLNWKPSRASWSVIGEGRAGDVRGSLGALAVDQSAKHRLEPGGVGGDRIRVGRERLERARQRESRAWRERPHRERPLIRYRPEETLGLNIETGLIEVRRRQRDHLVGRHPRLPSRRDPPLKCPDRAGRRVDPQGIHQIDRPVLGPDLEDRGSRQHGQRGRARDRSRLALLLLGARQNLSVKHSKRISRGTEIGRGHHPILPLERDAETQPDARQSVRRVHVGRR